MNNVIVTQFLQRHPAQCAREIEHFSLDDILFFFHSLSTDDAALLLTHILPTIAAAILQSLPLAHSKEIIVHMSVQALKKIMPRINNEYRAQLIQALPKNQQISVEHSLSFAMQTVGAFMNTHVLFLPNENNYTIKQSLDLIKKFPEELTTVFFCIDREGKLQGMVTLKDILGTSSSVHLNHIMRSCPLVLPVNTMIHSIITHTIWSEYSVLPVVDEEGILLGALEFEKIIASLQDFLFNQRKEHLFESLSHMMLMFSHTTEDIINEINEMMPPPKEGR